MTRNHKLSVAVLLCGVSLSCPAAAATTNTQFEQYVFNTCASAPPATGWDLAGLSQLCQSIGAPLFGAPPVVGAPPGAAAMTVSGNLGIANASSSLGSRKKKGIRERLEEDREKPEKGASADDGGWGVLVAPQYGNSIRPETALENGYQSELTGLVVGLDYRFSDSLVLGGTLGQTRDNAAFFNQAGSLRSSSNTATIYGTWLPSDSVAVDGYLGYGQLNFDSRRHIVFGAISGTASGSTSGSQTLAGLSANYQTDYGRASLMPFINLDYADTRINGYSESGTTLLELRYSDRSSTSFTGSLGGRVSTSLGYDWGTWVPSARLSAVHEFQNNARQIGSELVITPGTGLLVATDAPDRDYMTVGCGATAALNGGPQLFVDYEKRIRDRLLSSWAVSLGVLVEF